MTTRAALEQLMETLELHVPLEQVNIPWLLWRVGRAVHAAQVEAGTLVPTITDESDLVRLARAAAARSEEEEGQTFPSQRRVIRW